MSMWVCVSVAECVCLFSSPGHQGPSGRSDELSPNLFFNLQKLLKSLSVSGKHPEPKETERGRQMRKKWGRMFSNLSFAVPLITSHLVIKFILTFLFSLHHCPPAVCSSHFHLTSTFGSIFPSVFWCCYWEDSGRRKRPPVVCSLGDNRSLTVKAVWQLDLNSLLLPQTETGFLYWSQSRLFQVFSAVRNNCCHGICWYFMLVFKKLIQADINRFSLPSLATGGA